MKASFSRSLPRLQVPGFLPLGAQLAAVTQTMLPASQLWRSLFRRSWKPLAFPSDGFARISADVKIEEETTPGYVASRYYPVRIGEILHANYQVVGKLGYGITSTVWLARELRSVMCHPHGAYPLNCCCSERRHVALKLFIGSKSIGAEKDTELNVFKLIDKTSKSHPGREAVRSLLDSFEIEGPEGRHQCLVHPPLWESILHVRHRNPVEKLPATVVAFMLKRLFHALDFLHNECHIAHTDIKEANILVGADKAVLQAFEKRELSELSPRKEVDGRTIFLSRELDTPKSPGEPVLCDFGTAQYLNDGIEHREDVQPNVYRAPEIILDIPWTYSVDIWNVGCMVSSKSSIERSETYLVLLAYRYGMLSRGCTSSLVKIQS
jgi:serine/threonine-protein kinase SRPK3